MKKFLLTFLSMALVSLLFAQQATLKQGLSLEMPPEFLAPENPDQNVPGQLQKPVISKDFKNTSVVDIIDIGTSANAFGYGYAGGQRSLVCADDELGIVSNFHRMGGELDPGGYSGDLGFDASKDWGETWTVMNECYTISDGYIGFYETARYPQHGIFNPPGNTNPDSAYIVFFAPVMDYSNAPDAWGGYGYGCSPVGDPADTTKHLLSTNPDEGFYQYIPDGFTVTAAGNFWVVDHNIDFSSGSADWQQQLLISHGTWNAVEKDFDLDQFLLSCPTYDTTMVPTCSRVEFSKDGQYGYIVSLTDNGNVGISAGLSLYPVVWRTEDYGETWEGPIEVALAGEGGITEVQDFLSVDEIEELFEGPIPEPEEIPFTTAYDFDLTVDYEGNPDIAVVVGVTADTAYSIVTQKSQVSGYLFMAPFILNSIDKGNPGSWYGREIGRLVSFRGDYGEISEDNRIQITRDATGKYLFAAWLDTDTTVSAENNAPDIWARGFNAETKMLTHNYETMNGDPQNMTYGSEATFSAYFFAMANEVIYRDDLSWPVFILPMVYEDMTTEDPYQPVQFQYIKDAFFWEQQFMIGPQPPGIEEHSGVINEISEVFPNPATASIFLKVSLSRPLEVSVSIKNLTGQIVKQFETRQMVAGTNKVHLDVSALEAGIYFITVQAGGQQVARKLVVE